MEIESYGDLSKVAEKVVNLLADENVCIANLDFIFDEVRRIVHYETKIKKIEE